MHFLPLVSLLLVFIEGLTYTLSFEPQPYCYTNITETTHKVVTKTRLITVNKKGLFNKIIQKKETQVEIYEDYEPVYKIKVKRVCCEGYRLTGLDMCEPQCIENGCPPHSKCVEPEVCECMAGYFTERSPKDNKHYCKPICENACPEHSECVAPNRCACKIGFRLTNEHSCEPYCASGCPYGGKCVAPNKCQCPEGYHALQGSCSPICSMGDQCQNGKCIDRDVCVCHSGFEWNQQLLKCEAISTLWDWSTQETSTYYTDITDVTEENTDFDMEVETDIDSDLDDIDPNEVFDEIINTITTDDFTESDNDYSTPYTVAKHRKCPDDHVYYKGECKPLKFASNEIDCRFKACEDKHAFCLENGTCACNEGYQWFKVHVIADQNNENHTIKAMCLTNAEYEARKQQEMESQEEESSNWVPIFFIVLGVLILVLALVYLGLKLLRTQTGHMDVEGKNLACAYDSRGVCIESEKSVI